MSKTAGHAAWPALVLLLGTTCACLSHLVTLRGDAFVSVGPVTLGARLFAILFFLLGLCACPALARECRSPAPGGAIRAWEIPAVAVGVTVGAILCCSQTLTDMPAPMAALARAALGASCFNPASLWLARLSRLRLADSACGIAVAAVCYAACTLALDACPEFTGACLAALMTVVGALAPYVMPRAAEIPGFGAPAPQAAETLPCPPLRDVLTSAPLLYTALAAFTAGNTMPSGTEKGEVIAAWALSGLIMLAAVACCRKKHVARETQLSFLLFRIGLPVYACCALAIKVVPVEALSQGLFRHLMFFGFCLGGTLSCCFLAYCTHGDAPVAQRLLAATCLLCMVSCLVGVATSFLPLDARRIAMGITTSAFLLYEALQLGSALIEYSKPTDDIAPPDSRATDSGGMNDLDAACQRLVERCRLTPREAQVLAELAHGHSSGYIAQTLCISANTARSHMKNIYAKLGVSSREELIDAVHGGMRRG